MADETKESLLEKALTGVKVEITEDVVYTTTTVNSTSGVVESDAFRVLSLELPDENTSILTLRDIETGDTYVATWVFQTEKENNDG